MADSAEIAPQTDLGRLDVTEDVREGAHHLSGLANRVFNRVGRHWATEAAYEAAMDELVLMAEQALTLRRQLLISRDEGRRRIAATAGG